MKFKQFLLLITSVTSLGMILSSNKISNNNQNITFLDKTNASKNEFKKMIGTSGVINSLTFNGQQIYAVNNEGTLYKSNDNQSFQKINLPNYESLIATSNGTVYAGAYNENNNELKIYILNNDQLTEKYTLNSHQLLAMTLDKEGNIYIATNQGVYTNSTSSATELTKLNGTTGNIIILKTTNKGSIYVVNNEGDIFKSVGYDFHWVIQLKNGSITSIAIDNKETIFVTNESNQVYYKPVKIGFFLTYKQSLETINTSVISFETEILVGDKNGNIWKSYQSKDFSLLNKEKISSIKELIYNSGMFSNLCDLQK